MYMLLSPGFLYSGWDTPCKYDDLELSLAASMADTFILDEKVCILIYNL